MSLHPTSAADDPPGKDARHWVSAAMDGDRHALDKACHAWRDDPRARADWHAFHLIGDVLRSSELAAPAARDAAFLAGLRQKLAVEPVVLAPAAQKAAAQPATRNWRVPAAMAAGFVAVAGVLVVSQMPALSGRASAPVLALSSPPAVAVPDVLPRPVILRDPRLDEFLRAHQSAKGGAAVAVPGSSLRRVDVEMATGTPR